MPRIAAWHALAALLVLVFAHTFELWRWLTATPGHTGAAAIPVGLALALAGTLRAKGTRLALDPVDRVYWDTFVVPYGRLRLRVGVAGREDRWSAWREIELAR
jgi:hypothetical protein